MSVHAGVTGRPCIGLPGCVCARSGVCSGGAGRRRCREGRGFACPRARARRETGLCVDPGSRCGASFHARWRRGRREPIRCATGATPGARCLELAEACLCEAWLADGSVVPDPPAERGSFGGRRPRRRRRARPGCRSGKDVLALRRSVQEPVHRETGCAAGCAAGCGQRPLEQDPGAGAGSKGSWKGQQPALDARAVLLAPMGEGDGRGQSAPARSRCTWTPAEAQRAATRFRLFGCGGLAI